MRNKKKTFNYNTSSQKIYKTPNHGKVKFKTENGIGNGGGPSIHDTRVGLSQFLSFFLLLTRESEGRGEWLCVS